MGVWFFHFVFVEDEICEISYGDFANLFDFILDGGDGKFEARLKSLSFSIEYVCVYSTLDPSNTYYEGVDVQASQTYSF